MHPLELDHEIKGMPGGGARTARHLHQQRQPDRDANGEFARLDLAKSAPMLGRISLSGFIQPTEVASVISFLLSDDASMVNGVSIDVDGRL